MAKTEDKEIKNDSKKKTTTTKKITAKKVATGKTTAKSTKKKVTTKKTDNKTVSKAISKKGAEKKASSKVASKTNTKKTATKKSATPKEKVVSNIIEYYDLPVFYNQTTVKLLFQTPKKLFVYWEISEADKQKYLNEKGKDFFEETSPLLVVKNKTRNYTFEVEINDYANSWYFDIPDSNCEYEVELVRKHKATNITTPITTSNKMEVPNNTILFEQNRKEIFFKNVKTNDVVSKSTVNLQIMNHLGNTYNANSFYKKFYSDEDLISLNNPSS